MTTWPWEIKEPEYSDDATDMVPIRRELRKDANGLYPGEAERGIPDFLNRVTNLPRK